MIKIYDNFDEVKNIAEKNGIKKTIRLLFENIKKQKPTINSGDVKNVYDVEYLFFLDKHQQVKEINGFKINIYSQFFYTYFEGLKNKKTITILDFGCGTGELSFALSSIGFNVHGIDFSEQAIAFANNKKRINNLNLNPRFECIDYFLLTQKYDYIIFGDVVEHVSMNEFKNIIQKAKTLLNVNGKILINTPNGRVDPYGNKLFWVILSKLYHLIFDILNKLKNKKLTTFDLKHAYYMQTHVNVMYPSQIKKVFHELDFKNVEIKFRHDKKILLGKLLSFLGISTDMSVIAEIE